METGDWTLQDETDGQDDDDTIYDPVVFHSDDYNDDSHPIMADKDIRRIDGLAEFAQPEPVFVNDNEDETDNLFQDRRRLNDEIETNQIFGEQFDPLNNYDPNDPIPILFSDKRIDVKKPGPRIVSKRCTKNVILDSYITHYIFI